MEIVETDEPSDDVRQGFGNRRIDGVGVMRFAADLKAIDGRFQGPGYLSRRTAESDPVAAAPALIHGEPLGRQPGDYLRVIGGAQSEAIAELLRREPPV